jgi:hypothetical protein
MTNARVRAANGNEVGSARRSTGRDEPRLQWLTTMRTCQPKVEIGYNLTAAPRTAIAVATVTTPDPEPETYSEQ